MEKGRLHLDEMKKRRANIPKPGFSPEPEDNQPKRHFELNLSKEYWMKKFLYPYALDPAPLRLDSDSK